MAILGSIPDHILYGLLIGYGSLFITVAFAIMINSDSVKRNRIVDLFCSLIIALATVALVYVTFLNLNESKRLRESSQQMAQSTTELAEETKTLSRETKRLADLSVQQFKVISYPSLQSVKPEVTYENNKLNQKFRICNKGDITAHKVRVLLVMVYQKTGQGLFFNWDFTPVYQKDEPVKTFDIDVKLFGGGGCRNLTTEEPLYPNYTISDLKYCLLFLRFYVPYDSKYRYETFGYAFKTITRESSKEYHWQEINSADIRIITERHSKALRENNTTAGQAVRTFLDENLQIGQ